MVQTELQSEESQSMKSIAYAGMDVHKDSISVAIYVGDGSEPAIEKTMANDQLLVKKAFGRWKEQFELRCCYEASSCGYVLARWLEEMQVTCEIAAPSLIPVRPGDRYKTDRRDAKKLAKLYRAGELTLIHIPDKDEECARALVRCRETFSKEARQSKHYILKFLQLRGIVYRGGENWTERHWSFLRSVSFEGTDAVVWRELSCLLEYKLNRIKDLDKQIEEVAFSDVFREIINRLRCLRGIDIQSAMVLATEIGDFRRFAKAEQLMSYLGLAPGCYISGGSSKHCSITKAGNSRCRHVLVEAAWNYRFKPAVGARLRVRQLGQSPQVITLSWKAQHRLHKKYWKLANRMESKKAAVAVARELVGFIWAAATQRSESDHGKAA
jgi:transposase